MPEPTEPVIDFMGPAEVAHLRVSAPGQCWWCQARPATTGEHKFKRSDLARLLGEDGVLTWGDGTQTKELRGKGALKRDRHGVVKFPKSLCSHCNNAASQPFDLAYHRYSQYVSSYWLRISAGIGFANVFGDDWSDEVLALARYFAKHFGCRMVRAGVTVPQSLRNFLDGATDMPDIQMVLISNDNVHKQYGKGLSISPDFVLCNKEMTQFDGCVLAAYIGSMGVRFQWQREGIADEDRSQFFHYPNPVFNFYRTEEDMARGIARRPGRFARFTQWLYAPPRHLQ